MTRSRAVASGAALFDTALGRCGIAWSENGVLALRLPGGSDQATRKSLTERLAGAEFVTEPERWPALVRRAVRDVTKVLAGERVDLSQIPLDYSNVSPFYRRVYEAARSVKHREVCSYGDLAKALGSPGAARAVGQALGRNPFAVIVPCHRVLAAGGKLGGFTAAGGTSTKQRMLDIERDAAAH